ncbi:MAG: type transport system ATP-binding protein [Acidobacteriota bacterium]
MRRDVERGRVEDLACGARAGGDPFVVDRPALEALAVSKRYGDRHALRDVELVARAAGLHGLLGPNGAGKTTLMRILLGLVRRDGGTVHLLGRDLDTLHALPEGVAGFVDTPAFYPYLTGRRNLALLARLDGDVASPGARQIDDALDQAGLGARADDPVAGYSTGMRQRLALAAALVRSPRLLLLDEPTSSLDPAGARDVRALLRQIAADGAAVVLSSHDMAEVEELCTAVTIINRSRIVFSGTLDELRRRAPASTQALRTSNDSGALEVAASLHDVDARAARDGGLDVSADPAALDAYVIALGRAGIAVRGLERRASSLESLFLQLTEDGPDPGAPASRDAARGRARAREVS